MGVPPVTQFALAEILVTNVLAPDPRRVSVDHDDFAMVAKVDLESVAAAFAAVKWTHLDAGVTKLVQVTRWQFVAADLVVEEKDTDALSGFVDQPRLEIPTEPVVLDDDLRDLSRRHPDGVLDLQVALLAGGHVTLKLAASKDPIGRHRDIGKVLSETIQAMAPCDVRVLITA